MTTLYHIDGMQCSHCATAVESAVRELPAVEKATVNLKAGTLTVVSTTDLSVQIQAAIDDLGFECRKSSQDPQA